MTKFLYPIQFKFHRHHGDEGKGCASILQKIGFHVPMERFQLESLVLPLANTLEVEEHSLIQMWLNIGTALSAALSITEDSSLKLENSPNHGAEVLWRSTSLLFRPPCSWLHSLIRHYYWKVEKHSSKQECRFRCLANHCRHCYHCRPPIQLHYYFEGEGLLRCPKYLTTRRFH